jgi:apolipoprotein N-acyltransferase
VKVGLVASDAPENKGVVKRGADTKRLLHDYAIRAETLAAQGAQVVVIPEKIGVLVESDAGDIDALYQSLADKTNSTFVIGVVDIAGSEEYNQARIYRPKLPRLSYAKHHMLPPFESGFIVGSTVTVMTTPFGTWGIAICKDMDFTALSRQYGKMDAGLMLVPAWDFDLDRWEHGHMAIMRGVESGFSIARAAKQGYLTVADDHGRILAERQSDSAPFATLLADVPVGHSTTPYLLLGDWFAWFAIALAVLTSAPLLARKRMP